MIVKTINRSPEVLRELEKLTRVKISPEFTTAQALRAILYKDFGSNCKCGEKRKFKSLNHGYLKTCGKKRCRYEQTYDSYVKRFGSHPAKTEKVKRKKATTNLRKYGVKCSLMSASAKEKTKKTMIKRYGVHHNSQMTETREKRVNIAKRKERHFAIEFLLKCFSKSDIVVGNREIENFVGKIFYFTIDGKSHRYFPHIFVKSLNMIVETKSRRSVTSDEKREACIKRGFRFETLTFNGDGSLSTPVKLCP